MYFVTFTDIYLYPKIVIRRARLKTRPMSDKIEIIIDIVKKQEGNRSVRKNAYMTPVQIKNPKKVFDEICINNDLTTSSIHDIRLSHVVMFKTSEKKTFYIGFARKKDTTIGPKMNLDRMEGHAKVKTIIDYDKNRQDSN